MRKRIISAGLALCLALSLLPVGAWAVEDEGVAIASIAELAAALTPETGTAPTVSGDKIKLEGGVTLSEVLRIGCDAEINFQGHTVDMGASYIRVESGAKVRLSSSSGSGRIESSSGTAAVVAMRGCDLTINGINIEVDENANGYGILVHSDPVDQGKLDTQLKLNTVTIRGGRGGLIVDPAIKDTEAGSYPVLTLDNVDINWFSETERIGLYLAGMAKTTVTGSEIYGAPAIEIKSGTLVIDGGEISSWGSHVANPEADESGIASVGSAILIENNADYAGSVNITIDGNADVSGRNSHAIRELTAEGWEGVPPVIAVKDASVYGGRVEAVKTEYAQVTVSTDNWGLLPVKPQTLQEYGGNDKYKEAYDSIGLRLEAPAGKDDTYTLLVDELKLRKLYDSDDTKYWELLADQTDTLRYRAKFVAPVDNVAEAYVWLDEPAHPDPSGGDKFEKVEGLEKDGSFYYPVKVDPEGGPGNPEFVTVKWLGGDGAVLAVTEAWVRTESVAPWTVIFDANEGEFAGFDGTDEVSPGDVVPEPPEPTRKGYVFDGWYPSPALKTRWDFEKNPVTKDYFTLYAKWLEARTVTFESQGGSKVEPQKQTVGDGHPAPKPSPDPTREGGYRFDGWFKEADCKTEWNFNSDYVVGGDVTLYAKWQKTYDVTFDSQDGSAVKTQTVDAGGHAEKPSPDPTKDGYDFDGWYKDPEDSESGVNFSDYVINADVTLYAGWLAKPRTVTLDANGGTFASGGKTTTEKTDRDGRLAVEKLPSPSYYGYTFTGWFTEAEGGEAVAADTVFKEGDTIYAHWVPRGTTPSTPRAYTITFDANGGGSNETRTTGTDGKLASLPDAPSYPGHTFEGWFTAKTGGTQVTTSTVFQGHTTVFAHWKETSSSNPSDPSNPTNPSNPSGVQYQIFSPSATSGGSFSVSRSAAAEGERVTIRLSPWSGYQLYQLSVTNYATGRQLSLSRVSANEYSFVMPASSVSVAVTFTGGYTTGGLSSGQAQSANESAGWYFSGSSIYHRTSGVVSSAEPLSRDMLISVLYNLDGTSHEEPAVWAVSNGIVPDAYSSLLWGGDKAITREQAALILYCYAEYKGYGTSQRASLAGYTDYSQIRAAAQPAMSWARATGLMTGTSASTLSPQANLTCAQAGIVLSRFVTSVVRAR